MCKDKKRARETQQLHHKRTASYQIMQETNEIILYQPNQSIKLEVRLEDETVWLTQAQLSELFQRERTVITKHINNIFKEKELEEKSNVHFLHIAHSDKPIKYYSLDVIISVGYRVKSQRGVEFRQWANKVLKDFLLRGYALNHRLEKLEQTVADHSEKIDFFVRTSLPPVEGIFFEGQIFDAYAFATNLIKSAKEYIVLIDNYVDETTLLMLSKRSQGVKATIYTGKTDKRLLLDMKRHNEEYPPIELAEYKQAHDRFLLIDKEVYHIGASLKDLGKKWFAFARLHLDTEELIERIKASHI